MFDICIWKDYSDPLDEGEDDKELFKNGIIMDFAKKYSIPPIISAKRENFIRGFSWYKNNNKKFCTNAKKCAKSKFDQS